MPSASNAIFYPDVYSRRFEPRRSLSGIKVGLPTDPDHDRILETAAVNVSMPTHLLMDNVPIKVVSERAGHSSVTITLDTYGHVLPDMQKSVAELIDKRLQAVLVK
jgi:integrase